MHMIKGYRFLATNTLINPSDSIQGIYKLSAGAFFLGNTSIIFWGRGHFMTQKF